MGAGIQIQRQKEELQPTCCCQPLYYYYSVVVCFVLLYAFAFFVYCRVNFVRCSFTDVSCTTTGVCEINSLKLSTWSKRYRAGHPGNEYRRLHYTSLLPQVLSLAIFSLFCMNEISHNTTSTQKPFPWHYSLFLFLRPFNCTGSPQNGSYFQKVKRQVTKSEVCLIHCYNAKNQPSIYLSMHNNTCLGNTCLGTYIQSGP